MNLKKSTTEQKQYKMIIIEVGKSYYANVCIASVKMIC